MQKKVFEVGAHVVVCPVAMADKDKLSQLLSRSKLTEQELREGPLNVHVVHANGQLTIKPRKKKSFIVHGKFFVQATAHATA